MALPRVGSRLNRFAVLFVVDDLVLGVDGLLALVLLGLCAGWGLLGSCLLLLGRGGLLVYLGACLLDDLRQLVGLGLDGFGVCALEGLL